jgi:hypothetical protein
MTIFNFVGGVFMKTLEIAKSAALQQDTLRNRLFSLFKSCLAVCITACQSIWRAVVRNTRPFARSVPVRHARKLACIDRGPGTTATAGHRLPGRTSNERSTPGPQRGRGHFRCFNPTHSRQSNRPAGAGHPSFLPRISATNPSQHCPMPWRLSRTTMPI